MTPWYPWVGHEQFCKNVVLKREYNLEGSGHYVSGKGKMKEIWEPVYSCYGYQMSDMIQCKRKRKQKWFYFHEN